MLPAFQGLLWSRAEAFNVLVDPGRTYDATNQNNSLNRREPSFSPVVPRDCPENSTNFQIASLPSDTARDSSDPARSDPAIMTAHNVHVPPTPAESEGLFDMADGYHQAEVAHHNLPCLAENDYATDDDASEAAVPWDYAAGIDPEDEAFDSDDDSYMYVARPSVPLVNGRPPIRPPPRRPPPRIVPLPLDWNNDDDDDSLPSLAPRPLSDSEDETDSSDDDASLPSLAPRNYFSDSEDDGSDSDDDDNSVPPLHGWDIADDEAHVRAAFIGDDDSSIDDPDEEPPVFPFVIVPPTAPEAPPQLQYRSPNEPDPSTPVPPVPVDASQVFGFTDKFAEPKPGTVHTEKKIHRPKLPSEYVEPDLGPDLLDGQELIFKEYGKSLRKDVAPLPPRDDVILFDTASHQAELDKNIRWGHCPQELQAPVLEIIKEYWDVFCEEGLRRNIRGFSCRVDTGDVAPVCCKIPRCGPHESRAMSKLVDHLDYNGLTEPDDGPWGSQIVLAAKPGQDDTPWHEHIWRLCVSYRRVNQVSRPFIFPVPRCDDAVDDLGPYAKCVISFDLDCGYWQVTLEEGSRAKLAFFTPNGKRRWTVMPMGFLNSHAIFVAMMATMQAEWEQKAAARGLKNVGSKIIVDDVLLYAPTIEDSLAYFRIILEVLQHHRVTIKLKKCHFFEPDVEFVGVDVCHRGNSPAASKFEVFRRIPPPQTWTDLRMLIGMFGFYQKWLFNFEVRIRPFRALQARQPKPGLLSLREEADAMAVLWTQEHANLLDELKSDILSKPVLARPNFDRRFYVKTDWSKDAMGAVLTQGDDDPVSLEAEGAETVGGPCFFDRTRAGLRLRPVAFLSRNTTKSEQTYHSYVGEASVGRWVFPKWRKYLLGREFTWLADCSGLRRFFEGLNDLPTHMIQRWRAELLLFMFTIEHRPADMLTECNMLSRYNTATAEWRKPPSNDTNVKTAVKAHLSLPNMTRQLFPSAILHDNLCPSAFSVLPRPSVTGNVWWASASLASRKQIDNERTMIVQGALLLPVAEALQAANLPSQDRVIFLDDALPTKYHTTLSFTPTDEFFNGILSRVEGAPVSVDWYLACYHGESLPLGIKDPKALAWLQQVFDQAHILIQHCRLRAAMFIMPFRFPDAIKVLRSKLAPPDGWSFKSILLNNTSCGGYVESEHSVLLLLPDTLHHDFVVPDLSNSPGAMVDYLDVDTDFFGDALQLDMLNIAPSTPIQQAMRETPTSARAAVYVKIKTDTKPIDGWPAFNIEGPAPNIVDPRPEESFFNGFFGIWIPHPVRGPVCRPIRLHELLRLYGLSQDLVNRLDQVPTVLITQRIRSVVGRHALSTLFHALRYAEVVSACLKPEPACPDVGQSPDPAQSQSSPGASGSPDARVGVPTPGVLSDIQSVPIHVAQLDDIVPATLLPLPTIAQWHEATDNDYDLSVIREALQQGVQLAPFHLHDKGYYEPFRQNRLEADDDLVYYYERSSAARVRQLRVKVVPPVLRRNVVAACHSSPFSGHSGITRTLYRLQTRFWWPGLVRDATVGVRGCMHCNLANVASNEAQVQLQTLACDVPFDVIFLDIWSPGDVPTSDGTSKMLTLLDCMTSFAMGTFLSGEITAETVADAAISVFFNSVGLPRLIIVDADGLFAGVFVQLFRLLGIPVEATSRENHRFVRNERFHRYLNKVQRINTADKGSWFQFRQGALFSLYAWNAAPMDGTDICRALVAVGREFPFPIDLSPAIPRDGVAESHQALDHFEAASPLLYKQRQLLSILNAERRLRHRELRNKDITNLVFYPGDIVIVRKQVKSDAKRGFSAKLVFKAKGPYRVIERIGTTNSYRLQKLPFLRGLGRPGKIRKENAARMTKLPSTLVLHKPADGADSRFSTLAGPFSQTPLAKWLGVLRCGAYQQAQGDPEWAFEPLASMWSDELDPDYDSDDSDYVPSDDDDDDDDDDLLYPLSRQTDMDVEPEEVPQPTQAPLQFASKSDRAALRKLYKTIVDSSDRLFFVSWHIDGSPTFRLAQVDLDETDPIQAKDFGIYRVKWWCQHYEDLKNRSLVDSRFWPYVRKIKADGTLGASHPFRPDRAQRKLENDPTLSWQTDDIPLAEYLLVGPFDFHQKRMGLHGPKQQAVSESHHIDDVYWTQLERRAPAFAIAIEHIRQRP